MTDYVAYLEIDHYAQRIYKTVLHQSILDFWRGLEMFGIT